MTDPSTRPAPRRHARIALLPVDASQAPALLEAMLEAEPDEFLDRARRPPAPPGRADPRLWQVAESPESPADSAFRAAVALASYDPESERWAGRAGPVARQLAATAVAARAGVGRDRSGPSAAGWCRRSRTWSATGPRTIRSSHRSSPATPRTGPNCMAELVGDAGPGEFAVLLASKWTEGPGAAEALDAALARLARGVPGRCRRT